MTRVDNMDILQTYAPLSLTKKIESRMLCDIGHKTKNLIR